jgi:hypothetical protein
LLEYENGYSFSGWMDGWMDDCWNVKMDIPFSMLSIIRLWTDTKSTIHWMKNCYNQLFGSTTTLFYLAHFSQIMCRKTLDPYVSCWTDTTEYGEHWTLKPPAPSFRNTRLNSWKLGSLKKKI